MNQQTWALVITLLILLVALLQFVLQRDPQSDRVKDLETRLAMVEALLTDLQTHLTPK